LRKAKGGLKRNWEKRAETSYKFLGEIERGVQNPSSVSLSRSPVLWVCHCMTSSDLNRKLDREGKWNPAFKASIKVLSDDD